MVNESISLTNKNMTTQFIRNGIPFSIKPIKTRLGYRARITECSEFGCFGTMTDIDRVYLIDAIQDARILIKNELQ